MFHLLWFIHISGIILWLGGLSTAGALLFFMRRESDAMKKQTFPILIRQMTRVTHIGAGLLLLGGIPLLFLLKHATRSSFWVQYMGGVGIVVVLISLFVLSTLGKEFQTSDGKMETTVKLYARWLSSVLILSLSILVIVSFKL